MYDWIASDIFIGIEFISSILLVESGWSHGQGPIRDEVLLKNQRPLGTDHGWFMDGLRLTNRWRNSDPDSKDWKSKERKRKRKKILERTCWVDIGRSFYLVRMNTWWHLLHFNSAVDWLESDISKAFLQSFFSFLKRRNTLDVFITSMEIKARWTNKS